MEGFVQFGQAFMGFMNFNNILDIIWSTGLGIIIGALPGLTATMGVALLTTLTFKMAADSAVLILICIYVGAIYGGSRSAILLNIPGTPANAATCLDGFPLAKQGKAGKAIGLATTSSFIGSCIGLFFLAFLTPVLGTFALNFKSFEMFWLAVFGIVICGNLTAPKDPFKGVIAGFAGLFVAMIGMEGVHAHVRYAFGNVDLAGGIQLIPAMVGAFGFAEVIGVMLNDKVEIIPDVTDRVIPRLSELLPYWKTIIRSGLIGTIIGIIPGVGEDVAAWVSYDFAKRGSKHPETFGKGEVEGLIAAETGNNACIGGAIIPVLSLAVPGSAPAAVLLGAMFIHGVRPGPTIMMENPFFVYQVTAMFTLATVAMGVLGLSMVRPLVKVLQVPRNKLMPIVFVLCAVGAYSISSRTFDIGVMVVFGLIGFVLRQMDYPMAPLILGLILGDLLDKNLRRALTLGNGDISLFFQGPIDLFLIGMILFVVVSRLPWVQSYFAARKAAKAARRTGA